MSTKTCRICACELPVEDFYRKPSARDGFTSECKECRKARSHAHYVENKEQHLQLVKDRYDTFGRFRRYGLAKNQYEAVLVMQEHKCALCGVGEPGGKGVWHIDHRHLAFQRNKFNQADDASTFRGLLCHRCNIALGHYEALVKLVGKDAIERYIIRSCPDLPAPIGDTWLGDRNGPRYVSSAEIGL